MPIFLHSFNTCKRWYFGQFEKGIFYKTAMETTSFIVRGHMIHLSVATGSLRLDVAGDTRSAIQSHNSSKAEQVTLKFWIHSAIVKLRTFTSQKFLICGRFHVHGACISSMAANAVVTLKRNLPKM